jgi:hypothetical protein
MDRKYFTATDLGSYFHFSCQLALWRGFHEGRQPGLKRGTPGPRTLATFSKGFAWEETLVRRLEETGLILRVSGTTSLETQITGDPRNHFYIINASFKEEGLFKEEYIARKLPPVEFGTIKPDFIEIWKRVENDKLVIEWHVIDAKSSKAVKVHFVDNSLTVDFSSNASILLLEGAPTDSQVRRLPASPNGVHMATQRRLSHSFLTTHSQTSD